MPMGDDVDKEFKPIVGFAVITLWWTCVGVNLENVRLLRESIAVVPIEDPPEDHKGRYKVCVAVTEDCPALLECNSTQEDTCTFRNADCVILDGEPVCNCRKGYVFDDTVAYCEDIDECSKTPCDQNSDNKDGEYKCACQKGFELDADQITCKVCNEGYFGNNCGEECACLFDNTLSCDAVNGSCICRPGWTGDTCNNNVDECTDAPIDKCPDNTTYCINTAGSFTCKCHKWYQKTGMWMISV